MSWFHSLLGSGLCSILICSGSAHTFNESTVCSQGQMMVVSLSIHPPLVIYNHITKWPPSGLMGKCDLFLDLGDDWKYYPVTKSSAVLSRLLPPSASNETLIQGFNMTKRERQKNWILNAYKSFLHFMFCSPEDSNKVIIIFIYSL